MSKGGDVVTLDKVKPCGMCRRPFQVTAWTFNGSRWESGICETCKQRMDAGESNIDPNAQRKAWHIEQGYCTANTFATTWAKSNPAVEKPIHAKLRTWGRIRNVFICGPSGTGKTHAARCMLNTAFDAGETVAEISGIEFVNLAANTKGMNVRYLRDVNVVLFDDIDKPAWASWTWQYAFDLLDKRFEANRRTIVTCNTKPDEFAKVLGGMIQNISAAVAGIDRLEPMVKVEMSGGSLRHGRVTQ